MSEEKTISKIKIKNIEYQIDDTSKASLESVNQLTELTTLGNESLNLANSKLDELINKVKGEKYYVCNGEIDKENKTWTAYEVFDEADVPLFSFQMDIRDDSNHIIDAQWYFPDNLEDFKNTIYKDESGVEHRRFNDFKI